MGRAKPLIGRFRVRPFSRFWKVLKTIVGGLAGALAWIIGLLVLFGPAQLVLANPALQSDKFLSVMGSMEPLPRTQAQPWILPMGLLVISTIYSLVYSRIEPAFKGPPLRRGLEFGLVLWAIMVPWFEFYLPWNVMREPAFLVLLEIACWLGVMLLVGIAIAISHARIGKTDRARPDDSR